MKKINIYLLALIALVATSCTKAFDNLSDASEVTPITLKFNLNVEAEDLVGYDLTLKLTNYDENLEYSFPATTTNIEATGIVPGIYTAVISGKGFSSNAEVSEYLMNGSLVNEPFTTNGKSYTMTVKAGIKGNVIFKELYFCGVPSYYFRDQCYELYNNSNSVVYLDGLHIANLAPSTATTSLPTWEDGLENYVYAERVWKFPGNGTDYPLQPGESIIVAQHARNHQEANAESPVDLSGAEFEFYMGSTTYADMPAVNMDHVFYQGKADIGTVPQWLVSVFGGAYIIFKVPENSERDYCLLELKRSDRVIKFFCPEKHKNLDTAVWYFYMELYDECGEAHTLPGQVRVEFDGNILRQAKGKPKFIEILEQVKLTSAAVSA